MASRVRLEFLGGCFFFDGCRGLLIVGLVDDGRDGASMVVDGDWRFVWEVAVRSAGNDGGSIKKIRSAVKLESLGDW